METIDKQELHRRIDSCEDQDVLAAANEILKHANPEYDWWDDLTEDDKLSIAESEAQYERGDFVTFEEMLKEFDNRPKK